MSKITREEILKLAHISQIKVREDEIEPLVRDLQAVLDYASGLKKIADAHTGQDIMPLPHNCNVFKVDIVIPTPADPILAQAPEREERYFVVPKILK